MLISISSRSAHRQDDCLMKLVIKDDESQALLLSLCIVLCLVMCMTGLCCRITSCQQFCWTFLTLRSKCDARFGVKDRRVFDVDSCCGSDTLATTL